MHSQLATRRGVSQLEPAEDTRYIMRPENLPTEFKPLVQTSQWATMWAPHAAALAASEAEMATRWEHTHIIHEDKDRLAIGDELLWGAFDEWVWVNALGQHGFPYIMRGNTWVVWCDQQDLFPEGYWCHSVDNDDASQGIFSFSC